MEDFDQFFTAQHAYYQRKYGLEWRITCMELMNWWIATGKAAEKMSDSRKHRMGRIDERQPWTVDNLMLKTPESVMEKQIKRLASAALPPDHRILTKREWLNEVRNK